MTTIRYFVTRWDLAFGCLLAVFRSPWLWAACLIFSCYIGYDTFHDPVLFKYSVKVKTVMWIMWTLGVFVWMFGLVLASGLFRNLVQDRKGVLGEHRLSVDDEGLRESTKYNETLVRWPIFHKTVKTRGYLILYPNTYSFHIISRKRPLLEGNLQEFEAALKKKMKLPPTVS